MALDAYGSTHVNTEGLKRSYGCSIVLLAANIAASATDVVTLVGATGKIVKLTSISINAEASAAGSLAFSFHKRSTANTGGTLATAPTIWQSDLRYAPASSVVNVYTANPAGLGTDAGVIWTDVLATPAAASTGYPMFPYTFPNVPAAQELYPTLRSPSDAISLNLNGVSPTTGLAIYLNLRWTEEEAISI